MSPYADFLGHQVSPDPLFFLRILLFSKANLHSLLNGPLHGLVCDEHGDSPVKDLATGAAECVEDGGVEGSGKRVLTVLGEAVVDNALLGERACVEGLVRMLLVVSNRRWRSRSRDQCLPRAPQGPR